MAEENKKLTLVERAFALPDSEKEFGMKIADHKLICNVLDDHMNSVENMVDQKILKTLQSDELNNTIADKIYDKISTVFSDFMENISEGQKGIASDITKINLKLNEIETNNNLAIRRLDGRADANRDAVNSLRTDYEIYKEHLEYLAKVKPTLQTIQKVFKFWTWKENWLKIISIIVGFFVIIFALFWIFLSIMKLKVFVSLNDSGKKHSGLEQVWADIKTGHISNEVRAVKTVKLTDIQIDTMIAQKERSLIKPVTITYNKK